MKGEALVELLTMITAARIPIKTITLAEAKFVVLAKCTDTLLVGSAGYTWLAPGLEIADGLQSRSALSTREIRLVTG